MSQKQTVSYLKGRFEEAGIQIQKRHGQNFLIDLNLLHMIADSAELGPDDVVLEIGTGTGSLTALLAERAAAVVTVEIDPAMHQLASEELIDFQNVTMLQQDALRNKNTLHPQVLDSTREQLDAAPGREFKLVANLPYNVATPVISNLLAIERPPHTMTVTIQKELADRITARPGTKDFSALSIWVQSQCHTELVRVMPPEAFWPRPKVHSAILKITYDPELRARINDLQFFHDFVRAMFFHRRKLLRGVVLAAFKGRLDKPTVDEIIARVGISADSRAEELSVEEMIDLADAVRTQLA